MTHESTERRRFLAAAINTIQGIIGGTLAVVLGGAIIGPSFLRRRETWLKAGSLDALNENEPTPVTIRVARQDGYTQTVERQVVFLVKSGDGVKAEPPSPLVGCSGPSESSLRLRCSLCCRRRPSSSSRSGRSKQQPRCAGSRRGRQQLS